MHQRQRQRTLPELVELYWVLVQMGFATYCVIMSRHKHFLTSSMKRNTMFLNCWRFHLRMEVTRAIMMTWTSHYYTSYWGTLPVYLHTPRVGATIPSPVTTVSQQTSRGFDWSEIDVSTHQIHSSLTAILTPCGVTSDPLWWIWILF